MADVGRGSPPRSGLRRRSARPTASLCGSQGNPLHQPPPTGLPLAGVRIVDLTAFWAGPSATHSLAAFGADVIKIESIQRPDGIRYSGGMRTDVDDWWEYGWVFHAMNTNKRSVTLDLQSEDGIGLFKQLVSQADAVIENFSPRVMDQFGLGADALLDLKPDLVVVRMPAFGLTGPWRDRVGFAPTMEQIAGLAWVTGLPDGPPVPPRGACDPLAGAHAAFALLAALEFADRTGRGQLVEVPMIETVLNVTAAQTIEFERLRGRSCRARGNRGHPAATQDLYRCAGDDDWIAISVRTDDQRNALAQLTRRRRARRLVRRAGPATMWSTRLAERGNSGGRCGLAVAGDREPATAAIAASSSASNIREPGPACTRVRRSPRSTARHRWLHRPPPTLGQHNAEVLDRAVRADRSRPGAACRRRRDRHPTEGLVTNARPSSADRHLVEDRHVVRQGRDR